MYEYKVKVVKVVDGDTVDVDIDLGFCMVYKKQRVRKRLVKISALNLPSYLGSVIIPMSQRLYF